MIHLATSCRTPRGNSELLELSKLVFFFSTCVAFVILVEDLWKFPKNISRVLIDESLVFYFCWSLSATLNLSLSFSLKAIVLQRSSIVTLCFMKNSFSLWRHNHTHLVWLDSLTFLSRTFLRVFLVINDPLFRAYPKRVKCLENFL